MKATRRGVIVNMHIRTVSIVISLLALVVVPAQPVGACTNILVSRGASRDGSVFITYSADTKGMPKLIRIPGGKHEAGTLVKIRTWEDKPVEGRVRQVAETYTVVGLMNEHQLAIGETTTGGREALVNPRGMLDYSALIVLALQRARTAREAIAVIDQLVNEYGYRSEGETFSIADKNEVWMMEIIGKGPGVKGAVWVAARVPEGSITVHANLSRITTFPLDDPANWRYAKDVIDFAVKRGFYDPASGKPFSFRDAYHPNIGVFGKRVCAGRVWSIYRRVAPERRFSDAYFRGEDGAEDYPLFVEPTQKLALTDVMALMRDHFEGTRYDMTKGIDAGPFASPYRWRGLKWKVDGKAYHWERPISSQQAGFVMVCQSRNWLPDPVGGVYWFTPDDAYTSCFTPFYCGIGALPAPYARGDHNRCSLDSAWWVWNLVSNYTYVRWSRIFPEVKKYRIEYEQALLERQAAVEQTALKLGDGDPSAMERFLTDYSVGSAERLFERWRELLTFIQTRHNDGYVNDFVDRPKELGYPEAWLRRVVKEKGHQLGLGPEASPGH
jgi:dipeptidase